jgi:hypothetical protein
LDLDSNALQPEESESNVDQLHFARGYRQFLLALLPNPARVFVAIWQILLAGMWHLIIKAGVQ